MAYLNKVDLIGLYHDGDSIPEISTKCSMSRSTVRKYLLACGVKLRSRAEGIRMAAYKIGNALRGRRRGPRSADTKAKLSAIKLGTGSGFTVRRKGYIHMTSGPHKGRGQHVVVMEGILGRRISKDEVVHHIDEDTYNNSPGNLRLMTRSAHTSLHRNQSKKAA
jgi:hypothetical protein